nr:putative ribonuclease H-like domain-containing protein [Tanacetum cinerariifolium]
MPNSAIKLMLFPFSLAGATRRWLEKEPPHSILTWEDLVSKFINEFFPPSRTTNLRNEISNFQQRFDESFHEAWDRYKDLLRLCPHHGFTELHQLDSFYNALNPADQDSLNSAADGSLLERRTQDVLTIIENKSKCLAVDGNTFLEFRDNIQGYVSAAAVNYNQGNFSYRPPSVANQIRPPGPLPSNTIANPKGELKAITTRSGFVLDGPSIPMPPPFINSDEDERTEETLTNPELVDELKSKALADLGAIINLMLLLVWKKLCLPKLISTRMTLELANQAICTPARIARDVFVPVGKFTFPADFVIVDYESNPRVLLILGRPFLRTTRALIDVHGEEMIFRDDLFATNHLSGNPTFSSHTDLTSPKVINPLSGNTTSSSPDHFLEEFADELALITFPSRNDDLLFDIEFDLKEIEYLLNHDPTKKMDSILEDSVDECNLIDTNNDLVDTIPKMFTNELTLDYSSLPLYDDVDDDLVELEFDNDDVYDDLFDSKEDKIKESKLLIDEHNPSRSSDFLPSPMYVVPAGNVIIVSSGRLSLIPTGRVLSPDEHIFVQKESKARTTLLQSIPDDHVALTLKTKGGPELLSFDDLYYKLKTLEKAGRKIDFDKKESTRFNKKKVRCYKCQQRGHFTRECRAKGGNDKQRYSSFKIKEIGKKEEDSKALIAVDTLVDWTDHDDKSDGVIASKEFGMIDGCDIEDAIEEGAAKIYNLITRADTKEASTAGDAGEFTLVGVTFEDGMTLHLVYILLTLKMWKVDFFSIDHIDLDESQMSYGINSSTSSDSKSMSNDFVSCDDNDKYSEVNINDFASSDSSVKSSEPKPNDSTSCASTSSVSTSKNEAEIESNVGTPIQEPIIVNIPPTRPQPVPTGKLKVFAPVPTGRQNRPFPIPTDRGYSPSVISGWWKSTARPMPHFSRPTNSYFQTYTPYVRTMYYNHMKYGGDRWATAVKPSADCSWKSHRKGLYWVPKNNSGSRIFTWPNFSDPQDAKDEGVFDSGCSRSMTGNKERLDDFQELQQFNLFFISRICDKKNVVLFTDSECLVLSKDFKILDDSMVVLRVPRKHNLYTINLNNICPRGKQHKVSYKVINDVSSISEPLQLLHMDLFGPTSIRSIDHKYYCLVITDDYSRFCWVFFLEHKDKTYPILKDFYNLVENQLNKKVKAIRYDNGTEFKNAHINELCGSKGIKTEYSNARTPQQNGVAERKNRTLIEAARTMLAGIY